MEIQDNRSNEINSSQQVQRPFEGAFQDTVDESFDYKPLNPNQKPHYPAKFLEGLKKFGLGLGIGAGTLLAFALLPLTIVAVGLASTIAPPKPGNTAEQEQAHKNTMKTILISPGLFIAFAAINELGNMSETAKKSSEKVKSLAEQAVNPQHENSKKFKNSLSKLTYRELVAVQSEIRKNNSANKDYAKAVDEEIAFRKNPIKYTKELVRLAANSENDIDNELDKTTDIVSRLTLSERKKFDDQYK